MSRCIFWNRNFIISCFIVLLYLLRYIYIYRASHMDAGKLNQLLANKIYNFVHSLYASCNFELRTKSCQQIHNLLQFYVFLIIKSTKKYIYEKKLESKLCKTDLLSWFPKRPYQKIYVSLLECKIFFLQTANKSIVCIQKSKLIQPYIFLYIEILSFLGTL